MFIRIEVDITTHTTHTGDPDDRWDRDSTGLTINGVTAYESPHSHDWPIELAPGGLVHVLVEHYSDGDTFGSDEYTDVKAVSTDHQSLVELSKKLIPDHGYFGDHIEFHIFSVPVYGRL